MRDELGGHGQVVAPGDLGAVAAVILRAAVGLEGQDQHVREPLPQLFHRALRPARVGQRDGQEVAGVPLVGGGGQQIGERAAEDVQRAERRRGDPFGPDGAAGAQLDQPRSLRVPGLGERVRQRGAAVAQPRAQRLLAVQMPQRRVAEAVEQGRRDPADAADGDVPFGVARLSPGHPGVRHGHRADAAPRGDVGLDALDGAAEHTRVPARRAGGAGVCVFGIRAFRIRAFGMGGLSGRRGGGQVGADGVRLEVGHPVDRDRAMAVLEHHRLRHRPGPGAQVHPGGVDQGAAEAEPPRRIVVAADHDHARTRVPEPDQRVLAQFHGVHRRDGPVVDVPRHQHGVDFFRTDDADEMVQVRGLGRAEVSSVQRAAEVPIGRVQHPHGPGH